MSSAGGVSPAGPVVSVIVPTRNSARTIGACVASVRGQSLGGIELIVVDNGSVDATVDLAAGLADTVLTGGPERSAQRNLGAAAATGDYLLFVDADMRLEPGVAGQCVALARETGAPAVIIPEDTEGEGYWARCRALERSCYEGDDRIEAARLYTRAAFEAAGGYDEELTGGEDYALSARVRAGRRLPRTTARIVHDEGRVRLGELLRRKRYYGRSARAHFGAGPAWALRNANLVARPAFLRHWRRLAARPGLAAGVLVVKVLESGAAALGAAEGWRRKAPPGARGNLTGS